MTEIATAHPRRIDEACDYCYNSRVFTAGITTWGTKKIEERYIPSDYDTICICGPLQPCRDVICEFCKPMPGRKNK